MKHQKFANIELTSSRHVPGLELVRGIRVRDRFDLHFHEEAHVGVIEGGGRVLFGKRGSESAGVGHVYVVRAGEPHGGESLGREGWSFQTVFFRPRALEPAHPAFARDPDAYLERLDRAERLRSLFRAIRDDAPRLELEDELHRVLGPATPQPNGREHTVVRIVREYLVANLSERVSLGDLETLTGMNRYRLTREFKAALGIAPHAWHLQARVAFAKRRLAEGAPLATVADEAGFADQSHLHRHFRRVHGVSPGAYVALLRRGERTSQRG